MKQTAVEWFAKELNKWRIKEFGLNAVIGIPTEVFNQAKEMEKEQIKHSYETGARYALISQSDLALIKGKFPNPTEFYNETFKSE